MEYSEADETFTVEIEGGVPNYYYEWYVLKDSNETKVTHGATSDARNILLYRTVTFTKKANNNAHISSSGRTHGGGGRSL